MKTKISLREQRLSTHQVVSYFSLNNVKKHLSILALTIFLPVSNALHLDVSTRPETKANLFMSRLSARPFHIFFLWSPAGFYFCQSFSAVGPMPPSVLVFSILDSVNQTVLPMRPHWRAGRYFFLRLLPRSQRLVFLSSSSLSCSRLIYMFSLTTVLNRCLINAWWWLWLRWLLLYMHRYANHFTKVLHLPLTQPSLYLLPPGTRPHALSFMEHGNYLTLPDRNF